MNTALHVLVTVGGSLMVAWLAFMVALYVASRRYETITLKELLRLLPDILRLLGNLARDATLPKGVRVRLWLLLAYLLLPLDLVPDFIPIVGYLDDAIVVVIALRSVVKAAGPSAIEQHWSGNEAGLNAILRVASVTEN